MPDTAPSGNQPNGQPKTFWQTVADPNHPFWKAVYVALIVPCMVVTVNKFDADEWTILGKWIASAGGLAGILQTAKVILGNRNQS